MKNQLRALALVGGAALIALAAMASPALATYDQELTGEPATLEGVGVTQTFFSTTSGPIRCERSSFVGNGIGTMTEPTSGITTYAEITVHPTYEECRAFGLPAHIETAGCNFILTTATTTEGTSSSAHAVMHIECEPGHKIVVNAGAGGCIGEVGEQTPGGVVDLKNETSGTMTWQWTIESIKYHQEGPKCTGGTQELANGTMTGLVLFGGKSANTDNPVRISVT